MPGNVFEHIRIVNKQFTRTSVSFDNTQFENCTFTDCDLFYSGGPTFVLSCAINAGNRWHIQGAAALTIEALKACGWQIAAP